MLIISNTIAIPFQVRVGGSENKEMELKKLEYRLKLFGARECDMLMTSDRCTSKNNFYMKIGTLSSCYIHSVKLVMVILLQFKVYSGVHSYM